MVPVKKKKRRKIIRNSYCLADVQVRSLRHFFRFLSFVSFSAISSIEWYVLPQNLCALNKSMLKQKSAREINCKIRWIIIRPNAMCGISRYNTHTTHTHTQRACGWHMEFDRKLIKPNGMRMVGSYVIYISVAVWESLAFHFLVPFTQLKCLTELHWRSSLYIGMALSLYVFIHHLPVGQKLLCCRSTNT